MEIELTHITRNRKMSKNTQGSLTHHRQGVRLERVAPAKARSAHRAAAERPRQPAPGALVQAPVGAAVDPHQLLADVGLVLGRLLRRPLLLLGLLVLGPLGLGRFFSLLLLRLGVDRLVDDVHDVLEAQEVDS